MLHPVDLEGGGLTSALRALASNTKSLLKVSCRFRCKDAVSISEPALAKNLYRIAQEAVTNAVKHGKARNITIELNSGMLTVKSDGRAFPKTISRKAGLGLKIMQYRAEMIGGKFEVRRGQRGGAVVTCTFPDGSK
jgi:signal transduction histidine kinase